MAAFWIYGNEDGMKITDIEVVNLYYEYPRERRFRYAGGVATGRLTSLVRVKTDEGIEGIGYDEVAEIISEVGFDWVWLALALFADIASYGGGAYGNRGRFAYR